MPDNCALMSGIKPAYNRLAERLRIATFLP